MPALVGLQVQPRSLALYRSEQDVTIDLASSDATAALVPFTAGFLFRNTPGLGREYVSETYGIPLEDVKKVNPRIVYASSNHAVGRTPRADGELTGGDRQPLVAGRRSLHG